MSAAVRALIVDDEEPARRKVRRLLGADSRFEVVGEAGSGPQAVEAVVSQQPDLVFLDVEMPGFNGFEVIASLPEANLPHIIFTTAFADFALRAFEVRAVDYLLKPFDEKRFRAACDAYCERASPAPDRQQLLEALSGDGQHLERLLVRENDRLVPVQLSAVTHISAEEKYVRLHLAHGSRLHRIGLSQLAKRLDPQRFVRVHRSEVVNLDAIASIEPWGHGDATIHLRDGTQILASRAYRKEWRERFG